MNEKLDYQEMLEIPVTTCNITYKQSSKKPRKRKKQEQLEEVKELLFDKVNEPPIEVEETVLEEVVKDEETTVITTAKKPQKIKFKFGVIAVQFAVIGVLAGVILLSNLFIKDTGINVFLRTVFSPTQTTKTVDNREYTSFNAVLPASTTYTVNEGVMTFSGGKGSVYAPCDGVIQSVTESSGKYIVEIAHSDNFTTKISGISHAYFSTGDRVYGNIPIGYMTDDVEVCFYDGAQVITDYNIDQNEVVWVV